MTRCDLMGQSGRGERREGFEQRRREERNVDGSRKIVIRGGGKGATESAKTDGRTRDGRGETEGGQVKAKTSEKETMLKNGEVKGAGIM